jgi:hypothetical protein
MKILFAAVLVCCASTVHGQIPPLASGLAITRFGEVIPEMNSVFENRPFRPPQDSIRYCEVWAYDASNDTSGSLRITGQCEQNYYHVLYDSVLRLESRGYLHPLVPLISSYSSYDRLTFTQTSDSTYLTEGFAPHYGVKQEWTFDNANQLRKISVQARDCVMVTFFYTWHADGRINHVIRYGDASYLQENPDMATLCSYEYVYDRDQQLICYTKHEGLPYPDIADSLSSWQAYFHFVYPDSVAKEDYYMLYPSGSGLLDYIQFDYENRQLVSTFYHGFVPMSDTLDRDSSGRITCARTYQRGHLSWCFRFHYSRLGELTGYTYESYVPENPSAPVNTSEYRVEIKQGRLFEFIELGTQYSGFVRHIYRFSW